MKHLLDKVLNFTISKKLSVFILGTIFMFNGSLTAEQWLNLSFVYIGTQGAIDAILTLRNKK